MAVPRPRNGRGTPRIGTNPDYLVLKYASWIGVPLRLPTIVVEPSTVWISTW